MSEEKHTPGPWRAAHDETNPSGSQWGVVHGPGMWICDCFDNAGPLRRGMGEPNARLIAAAPDLLSNLIGAANYIDKLGGDSKSYRAAIAKALPFTTKDAA